MKARQARTTSGDKTICVPMPPDQDYTTFVEDTPAYREYLDAVIQDHPELFPSDIDQGYSFHGFVESGKLHLRTRRILLKSRRQAYQIRPDTVMPYMGQPYIAPTRGLALTLFKGGYNLFDQISTLPVETLNPRLRPTLQCSTRG